MSKISTTYVKANTLIEIIIPPIESYTFNFKYKIDLCQNCVTRTYLNEVLKYQQNMSSVKYSKGVVAKFKRYETLGE